MKKILILLFVFFLSGSLIRYRFSAGKKEEVPVQDTIAVQETKEETVKEEEKQEIPVEDNKTAEKEEDGRVVYRMLDFDRRLILNIGIQDEWVCSIFNLAYARAILDESFKVDPYDYYDGYGAVWRDAGFEDMALSDPLDKVLKTAYDELNKGRPTIFFVSGTYCHAAGSENSFRTSEDHYVLLLGYRADADYNDLKASDFFGADPSGGYCCSVDSYMPWVVLTDEAPALVSGEYALYGLSDKSEHVDTCLAYADTINWDGDRSTAVYPDYVPID